MEAAKQINGQSKIKIDIVSLFPDYFRGPFDYSIVAKARQAGIVSITHHDLRGYGVGPQKQVDDRVYGGGPGMVLKPEPLLNVLSEIKRENSYTVLMSPQGKQLNAAKAQELSLKSHLIFVCGHYEGIDERVRIKEVDEEISIGDYVLTNGALASIVVIDALLRFVPGVIGNSEAAKEDSFENGLFDAPHYTRPVEIAGMKVPSVLLNGDHKEILLWRKMQAMEKTRQQRPDLYLDFLMKSFSCSCKEVQFQEKGKLEFYGNLSFEGHIVFVSDLKQSKAFYEKIPGFCLVEVEDYQISFSYGEGKRLHLKKAEEMVIAGSAIMVMKLSNQEHFIELCSVLQKMSTKKPTMDIHLSSEQMFFRDPDGYQWAVILKIAEDDYV